ncbi:hypothetical protein FQA39_LY09890 [Lamprigera yunnana]|nr:hypothetical protein FQA39_LY09890 [Lamprigera yunnana]
MATDGASTQMQFSVEDFIQTTVKTLMVQQEQEAARARPNLEIPATPFRHDDLAAMLPEVDTDNVESYKTYNLENAATFSKLHVTHSDILTQHNLQKTALELYNWYEKEAI